MTANRSVLTRLPEQRMSSADTPRHASVLPDETIHWLAPKPGEVWVDATLGVGGHARRILEKIGPEGRLIGLDQDPAMLSIAKEQLAGLPVELRQANFDQLAEILDQAGFEQVDGLLADLGFCSDQLADPSRGLSFREEGPLDMRLDPNLRQTAADLINTLSEPALAELLWEYGEEKFSRRVAKRLVDRRKTRPFETTTDLAAVIRLTVPRSGGIDPATRAFQALRIAVNDELGALDRLLAMLPERIKPGGRVGIISFHSLEDRRVKWAFRDKAVWDLPVRKPVEAGDEEILANPRARSAKLRVAVRVGKESMEDLIRI